MTTFKSHLTVLETSASLYSSSPVFRIPQLADATGEVEAWIPITYRQFHNDVELVAKYWTRTLRADGLPQRTVVGLWSVTMRSQFTTITNRVIISRLAGWSYSDVLQIYGLSRAGYVPQLFSLRLPNPDVVFELLEKANAKALIHEPSFGANLENSPVPLHAAVDVHTVSDLDHEPLPLLTPSGCDDDPVLIFHTSGSTSGSPKLVPCSYKWLNSIVHKAEQVCKPRNPKRQDVTTWMGST
jgi:acyl-CoA synthetase (AMP-forming)/AMP-acid ligase II